MAKKADGGPAARPRIGIALAGGGAEGAIWEVGALRALEDALGGADLNGLDIYVGVSAGAVIGACLANGITPTELCRDVVAPDRHGHFFLAHNLFRPAYGEYARRAVAVPGIVAGALWDYATQPGEFTLFNALGRLSRVLPVGLFDNAPLRDSLAAVFARPGRTDDFRELAHRFIVVATDLDSGTAVRFGAPPFDDVPISQAVQASAALPGLYPPVQIGERFYVDGVLLKTMHASVALDAGATLVLCVNPIVPVDTEHAVSAGAMRHGRLANRGLPTVLSQTFRTLVHSRLDVGMDSYGRRYPKGEIVLVEPQRDDYRMFFTNIFRLSTRRAVCEHAFDSTRRSLLERRAELEPLLARHGVTLRVDLLADPGRSLWQAIDLPEPRDRTSVTVRLDRALTSLDALLEGQRRA